MADLLSCLCVACLSFFICLSVIASKDAALLFPFLSFKPTTAAAAASFNSPLTYFWMRGLKVTSATLGNDDDDDKESLWHSSLDLVIRIAEELLIFVIYHYH